MNIMSNEELIKIITSEVVKKLQSQGNSTVSTINDKVDTTNLKLELNEVGEAKAGTRSDEVVIALAPAFGISSDKNYC